MRIAAGFLALSLIVAAAEGRDPWLDVPFVQQVEAGCGSAAIAMVMQYWLAHGSAVEPFAADAEQINSVLKPDRKRGLWGSAMKAYMERNGFSAFIFSGEMKDLQAHMAKGRPVIVALAPSGAKAPYHFVVVTGLDTDFVYLHDPARGKLIRENTAAFAQSWKITDGWSLLAVPRR